MVSADLVAPAPPVRNWTVDARRGLTLRRPAELIGVINVTPDSFSDGGENLRPADARATALRLIAEGAAWLDVGGESSRPGAAAVSQDQELTRAIPVIAAIRGLGVPVSIDTTKPAVARAALDAGAAMVNDISAGGDPGMFPLLAERGSPVVLMHMQGAPATMQVAPRYADVVDEVIAYLTARMAAAVRAGIATEAIVLDPGIGFGKTAAHNLALLRALPRLAEAFDRPLLVGISRKSFLATVAGSALPAASRDCLSHALHGLLARHCSLLRVHDVAGAAAATRLVGALAGDPS
ncbi:MAG: dihydropteroate synthase [Planctomycetes bacterium]|nr:dihydropteroate synthase [Planctomycetota bacterium]